MFWVKMSDLRPFITQQYVFTDNDNNLLKTTLDDYFLSNMYKGDIYKYKNLRNLSMMQMYPDKDQRKHAQDSIEKRLASFDANIWVPTREELKERRERQDSIEAANNAEEIKNDNSEKKNTSVRSTRAKSKRAESSSSSKKSTTKVKKAKTKSTSSSATRSVRRRK